ncbi:50S ribosomal protein L7ae [Erysipelothrix sp. HDW6C]|uniref:L7Ae/L30e/S12e/Gadd45 family ribosomal protein n=1 Tax=Erysipelothrix sp. HDW6C TaxID=2714930 RepID=UPI00140E4CE0|nr:ribosomal L7Ae/L30e/S12e/Gadd45 family protein [Erysipelothrix sp. HDW6C]QIK70081.1 50S ribosomal protein L7ae [Erysipelothrix sp. HDW6C]
MLNKEKFLNGLGLCKRAGKLVYGDELLPAVRNHSVKLVILADDASDRTRKQIKDKSQTSHVDVIEGFTKDEISWAIGMVNRVAIGITDAGLAKLLKTNL